MAFIESPRFPVGIGYGSAGGPGYRTSIIELDSGAEERVGFWSSPRFAYDVRYGITSFADMQAVVAFYIARRGPAVAFRFKDFADYSSSAAATPTSSTPVNTDQQIGIGDASTTQFQLTKTYTDLGASVVRNITKPVAGSVVVAKDGANQASGWTVDTTTGIVTFTSAPANGVVITAGYEFDVPVRFGASIDPGLAMSIDSFETANVPSIPLVEVISELPCTEDAPGMGAATIALAASGSFTRGTGRLLKVTPAGPGLTYTQTEVKASLPLGGPHHRIHNAGADALVIKDANAATIVSIAAGASAQLWVSDAGSGNKAWIAY